MFKFELKTVLRKNSARFVPARGSKRGYRLNVALCRELPQMHTKQGGVAAVKQSQVSDVKVWYAQAFCRCSGQRISGKLRDLLQRTQQRVNFAVLCGSGCNDLKLHWGPLRRHYGKNNCIYWRGGL